MVSRMALIEDAAQIRMALSPLRRRLLAGLRRPGSAVSLAAELGMPRQKVGYHLRALEAAGLLTLVEERRRRGFTERMLVASADAFVIDPDLLGAGADAVETQDRHAAEHLVGAASKVVREVSRMQAAAEAEGRRLLTFTIEADLLLAAPADLERFGERLAAAAADLIAEFKPASGGRRYRLVAGAHPAAKDHKPPTAN